MIYVLGKELWRHFIGSLTSNNKSKSKHRPIADFRDARIISVI